MLKISDAVNLGFHAMAILGADRNGRRYSVIELANHLAASENHLAKIMQRLSRQGLVQSKRGPSGGFVLARPAVEITLLEIYEAIDGPLPDRRCLMDHPILGEHRCLYGDLLGSIQDQVSRHLQNTTLESIAIVPEIYEQAV
ncbi:MAG: Rrf2 family transcriptional regulator [Candidatus Krumholzibacteriota bacterium]|nr:Rrf2 family transcriptional regulator [Candidatus Krumholzibacteriota bacterium]